MRLTYLNRAKTFAIVTVLAALSAGCAPLPAITRAVSDTTNVSTADAKAPAADDSQAQAQPYPSMATLEQYLMADSKAEIDLARTAAPAAISSDATVLVLTPRGYETAVHGTNGFVCLVDRAWQAPFADPEFWNPNGRSPVCLNSQAARSVLPIQHKRTELALAGRSKPEIMARITIAIDQQELGPPEIGAMSYMMSPDQYLNDADPRFQPHVMFYVPNTIEGRDWGANLPHSPVMVGPVRLPDGGREPLITFVVPVSHWSDGTAASGGH